MPTRPSLPPARFMMPRHGTGAAEMALAQPKRPG
jgi:hypothetical protein